MTISILSNPAKSVSLILLTSSLLAPSIGCEAEPDDDMLSDEARLLRVAERQGFDVSEAIYDGELLIIDDVAFGPEHLAESEDGSDGETDFRGYLRTTAVSKSRLDVCLVLDDVGTNVPDASWFWAFALATYEWNARTDTAIDVRFKYESDPDDTWCDGRDVISVSEGNTNGNLALAQYPFGSGDNRRVGSWIRVSPGSSATYKTAMHEIGHNFAFAHPDDANGTRVSGTAAAASNYPSVMWRNNTGPAGNNDLTRLTDDDVETIERVYGTIRARRPGLLTPALPLN